MGVKKKKGKKEGKQYATVGTTGEGQGKRIKVKGRKKMNRRGRKKKKVDLPEECKPDRVRMGEMKSK